MCKTIATNGFLTALKFTKFVFVCPGPHWGSLQRSKDPLAGLRGHTSKGRGKGRRAEREEGTQKEREVPDPLSQIPGYAPVPDNVLSNFYGCQHKFELVFAGVNTKPIIP